jgi:hypothetical protein
MAPKFTILHKAFQNLDSQRFSGTLKTRAFAQSWKKLGEKISATVHDFDCVYKMKSSETALRHISDHLNLTQNALKNSK